MIYLEKYTGEKTYILGSGELGTKERILQNYPAALDFVHVAGTDEAGECLFSLDPLSRLRSIYEIDASLTEAEAMQAIQDILNTKPEVVEVDETAYALNNIAAQLEFQNMMALEDMEG